MKGIKIFVKRKEKGQYGRERHKNIPKHEKQRLMEYGKKYLKMRENAWEKFSMYIKN